MSTARQKAEARVAQLKAFYIHAIVFILVNIGIYLLSFVDGEPTWPVIMTLGWGLGLAIHGLVTAISGSKFLGQSWQQKKIQELASRYEDDDE